MESVVEAHNATSKLFGNTVGTDSGCLKTQNMYTYTHSKPKAESPVAQCRTIRMPIHARPESTEIFYPNLV